MTKLSDFRRQRINTNRHTDKGSTELRDSIRRDGWIGALTVTADGETFDGSNRLAVGSELANQLEPIVIDSDGTRPVIVRRTDIANTDDLRAKRLGFFANHIQSIDYNPDADIVAAIIKADPIVERIALDDGQIALMLQHAGTEDPEHEPLDSMVGRKNFVHIFIAMDDVGSFEKAILSTGLTNRADAIKEIISGWLRDR